MACGPAASAGSAHVASAVAAAATPTSKSLIFMTSPDDPRPLPHGLHGIIFARLLTLCDRSEKFLLPVSSEAEHGMLPPPVRQSGETCRLWRPGFPERPVTSRALRPGAPPVGGLPRGVDLVRDARPAAPGSAGRSWSGTPRRAGTPRRRGPTTPAARRRSSSRTCASQRSAPSWTISASGSAVRLWYQTGCSGAPPFEATRAYFPSCSTFISAILRSLPDVRPRVVKMTTGRPVSRSVLASRPSVAS